MQRSVCGRPVSCSFSHSTLLLELLTKNRHAGHACFEPSTVLKQNALPDQQVLCTHAKLPAHYACIVPLVTVRFSALRLLWKGEGSQ